MNHPQTKPMDRIHLLSALAALAALISAPALAQTPAEPVERATPPEATPQTRLADLMMQDEEAHMAALRAELAKANSEGQHERVERLTSRIDSVAADYRDEKAAVVAEIENLDEEQVDRLAEALAGVEDLGVNLDIDADALGRIHTARYDLSQIERLVSAYEQTEELSRKATRLTVEAETTGNQELLEEAQKAAAEAEKQREKLLERGGDL